jgi:dienelactone hydrolase
MQVRKILLPGLFILIMLGLAGFVAWANTTNEPMVEAQTALISDSQVIVQDAPWLVFRPAASTPTTGLVYYPGGRVDPRAYAPMARAIAQQGYLVVIVPMPLNLAIFGSERGQEVLDAYPEIDHWAIGGHSLGGSMAARFAHRNPGSVQGLALMASYPASSDDLSQYEIEVLSIYGTNDGVMAEGALEASKALLPADTRWIAIEGGNHAQFGWYGEQAGDAQASISRLEQQQMIVGATIDLLEALQGSLAYQKQAGLVDSIFLYSTSRMLP